LFLISGQGNTGFCTGFSVVAIELAALEATGALGGLALGGRWVLDGACLSQEIHAEGGVVSVVTPVRRVGHLVAQVGRQGLEDKVDLAAQGRSQETSRQQAQQQQLVPQVVQAVQSPCGSHRVAMLTDGQICLQATPLR
jgi:hypothetical protein